MRDLALTLFVLMMLPVAVARPFIGLMLWAWIGYMNPHRLTWSFAYNFRFNLLIALATIIGILFSSRVKIRIPWTLPILFMALFAVWTIFTSQFAFRPTAALELLDRFIKIQIMIFATIILTQTRRQIISIVMVIAFSVGFFGLKGGLFTIMSGGNYRVMGPALSFFEDNNAFALAQMVNAPLFVFFMRNTRSYLIKIFMLLMIVFSLAAILGSYSRGGFIGLSVVLLIFWMKSRQKIMTGVLVVAIVTSSYFFMPTKWLNRMHDVIGSSLETMRMMEEEETNLNNEKNLTIFKKGAIEQDLTDQMMETFSSAPNIIQDKSMAGRLHAWRVALLIVEDRPILGGGLGAFEQQTFDKYTPGVMKHAAHSIYFEVLGEQGYVGFILWLCMHISVLYTIIRLNRRTRYVPELHWVRDLSGMIWVGLFGYYSAGAFLGMAYFDLPYHLIAIVAILKAYTDTALQKRLAEAPAGKSAQPMRSQPKWRSR
ncbi:MAG: putative O-glycosylation ligase, exosortase A system-associated [Magnetococcales bacterium]|nr:putative O-glycosylation ligase, exosortase A system-associated [Magnetococcales bacterium]